MCVGVGVGVGVALFKVSELLVRKNVYYLENYKTYVWYIRLSSWAFLLEGVV